MLAVRTDQWKLVTYPDTEELSELYDLKNDPYEMTNLIKDPAYQNKIAELQEEIDRLVKETDYKSTYAVIDKTQKRGLMLKYDFENSDGQTVKDLSGNGNDGKIANAAIVETDRGAALKCSPESYVTVNKSDSLDTTNCPLTVSVWIKAESDGTVLTQGEGGKGAWSLFVEDGIPCFAVRDIGKIAVADGMESCLGKWTHLAAIINHDKLEYFVDRKKVASVPRGRNLVFFGDISLTIGKEQGRQVLDGLAPAGSFEGLITDLDFYREYKSDLE
jgi:hypothetical protein